MNINENVAFGGNSWIFSKILIFTKIHGIPWKSMKIHEIHGNPWNPWKTMKYMEIQHLVKCRYFYFLLLSQHVNVVILLRCKLARYPG